jgi:hypothetical protein
MEDDEAGAVDWNVVQVQLDSIGDPWKQPRFDSLPHVVGVLTSPNPEQTLQSLREQRDLVEHLVDGVVHNYNTGFSKAIQNYSQILRVFSDSTGKVEELKGDLENARMLLGARHKQLQQQWSRSVTLRHVISLLDQIDKVAQVRSTELLTGGCFFFLFFPPFFPSTSKSTICRCSFYKESVYQARRKLCSNHLVSMSIGDARSQLVLRNWLLKNATMQQCSSIFSLSVCWTVKAFNR